MNEQHPRPGIHVLGCCPVGGKTSANRYRIVNLRLVPAVYADLTARARREGRSIAGHVRHLVSTDLARQPRQPQQPQQLQQSAQAAV